MVNFHLPSFARNYKLNMLILHMIKYEPERFRENIRVASVYGDFPLSLWNGGRIEEVAIDPKIYPKIIEDFNSWGVPIRYTFTNPLITEEHLDDKYCNYLLKIAHNGLNEVIVVSPILEEYIRKNYPKYPVVSSTCKHIEDKDELLAELKKDYKMVVLDYNLNNQFDFLETIEEKDKCEFLCYEVCIPNCPRRHEHQNNIGQNSINYINHLKTGEKFTPIPFHCDNGEKYSLYDVLDYPTVITPEGIFDKYVPMGFSNFKLESRATEIIALADFYAYYLAKPEYRDRVRIELFMHLNRNGVYKVKLGY
ncbi:MAG: hypothetical protein LBM93_11855 [Oscillospiraceae bacterium]|jgi:hypothetical protein|nr:hypothetical protein [Oscillospiraceae bacterium]